MIRPKNETEDLIFSITKNWESLLNKLIRNHKKHLKLSSTNQGKLSHSNNLLFRLDSRWMTGLTSVKLKKSISIVTEEIRNFEQNTDIFDEFSFMETKDEFEEIFGLSEKSHKHLQDKILGPRIFKANKNLSSEKRQTDGYYMFLLGYVLPPFRYFESYPRIVLGLDKTRIQLILIQDNSNFSRLKYPQAFI